MKENNNTANIINAGGMNIKETVIPMKESCLKANTSIILNDVFKVAGIHIGIFQKSNIFVSMQVQDF